MSEKTDGVWAVVPSDGEYEEIASVYPDERAALVAAGSGRVMLIHWG